MQPTRLPLSAGSGVDGPVRFGLYSLMAYAVMKPEINRGVVIPLKFTTTDGQELPLQDYAAVPRELLRKLEEIAIRARELIAAHKVAILGGTSNMVEKAMSDLTKDLSALEEIWDFEASCIRAQESGTPSDTPETDSDKGRIQAGH